jgi:hypothetical protein
MSQVPSDLCLALTSWSSWPKYAIQGVLTLHALNFSNLWSSIFVDELCAIVNILLNQCNIRGTNSRVMCKVNGGNVNAYFQRWTRGSMSCLQVNMWWHRRKSLYTYTWASPAYPGRPLCRKSLYTYRWASPAYPGRPLCCNVRAIQLTSPSTNCRK